MFILDRRFLYPSPPPPSPAGWPMQQRHSSVLPSCVDEICVLESSGSDGGVAAVEEKIGEGSGGGEVNGVLLVLMKVFVVAVLAFATKRLTVGVTISAALLLFLEYLGKHRRLLKTAAATSTVRGKLKPEQQLERSKCSVQEIQPFQTSAGVEEIQPEEETVSNSTNRNKLDYQEIELLMAMKREESTVSNRKTRKARIKSNIQKIVSKKFRRSKKEQEEQCYIVEEFDNETISSTSSSVSDRSYREEGTICLDHRLSDANEEADTKIEEKGATEVALGRRYMLLCLIILVGLIGGRSFALMLTLSCFLLLKLEQKLLPRSIKLFIIGC